MTNNGTKRSRGQDQVVPLYMRTRNPGEMSRHRLSSRDRAAFGELPTDLYGVPGPRPRLGRPLQHDVESWRVIDDWPARVPATAAEIDVFEAWSGDLFDGLFGPCR